MLFRSLDHGPKYRCRKINRGRHTLNMRMNGTQHDIPNTTHLREKGRRKEGVLKSTKPNRGGYTPKSTKHCRLAYIDMLASSPFLLVPGRSYPSSMHPRSMFVYAKAKTRNQETSNDPTRKSPLEGG